MKRMAECSQTSRRTPKQFAKRKVSFVAFGSAKCSGVRLALGSVVVAFSVVAMLCPLQQKLVWQCDPEPSV